ncbi:uncharacterized protein [Prorops nasuta]|uniref:uncharacterized protein n=1 Tax=Prorops nasuta TaxID=863751 RepID=UPI0034CE9390
MATATYGNLDWIEGLTEDEARKILNQYRLDDKGILPTLRQRLRKHFSREKSSALPRTPPGTQSQQTTRAAMDISQLLEKAAITVQPLELVEDIPNPVRVTRPDTPTPISQEVYTSIRAGTRRKEYQAPIESRDVRDRSLSPPRGSSTPTRADFDEFKRDVHDMIGQLRDVVLQMRTTSAVPTAPAPREEYFPEEEEPREIYRRPNRGHFQTPRFPRPLANRDYAAQFNQLHSTLKRMNVSFSGKSGEDVEAFLARIAETRIIFDLPDAELLKYLPLLLSDMALHWFRSHQRDWENWAHFERAFRSRFGARSLQVSLRVEIAQRTQAEDEPVDHYLTCIRVLLERVSPPMSEEEWIIWAHTNMLPRIQALIDINNIISFDALESRAIQIESSLARQSRYRAPPLPEHSLFPDLAFGRPARRTRTAMAAEEQPVLIAQEKPKKLKAVKDIPSPAPSISSSSGTITNPFVSEPIEPQSSFAIDSACWNYKERGHRYSECPKPLYGKRTRDTINTGSCPTTRLSHTQFPAVNLNSCRLSRDFSSGIEKIYSLTTALLYIQIRVQGHSFLALVDSGASRTFIGKSGLLKISSADVNASTVPPVTIVTANGHRENLSQCYPLQYQIEGRSQVVPTLFFPSLAVPLIFGIDALQQFGIVINYQDRTWSYRDDPSHYYRFVDAQDNFYSCNALRVLTDTESEQLRAFLDERIPILKRAPGLTNLTEHRIIVETPTAIKQRYYPVSPVIQQAINREVDRLLHEGIIEPSDSDWSSPIVMVRKSNGSYRFCLDFRKVNEVSRKDAYPLPFMNSILDKLRSANYISALDLSEAYFQVPMEESSKSVTAFTVPGRGLFQFKRMPFGLTGAPATFQRLLDKIITPDMEPHAFAYLDDIIIVTQTFSEHLEWLDKIFKRIIAAGLLINPDKSEFCKTSVTYLGFIVDHRGLSTDPEKIRPIIDYPAPRNIKELRRFIGMASWYRRFVPDFATIVAPLNQLLKKNQAWVWATPQSNAFDTLKRKLTSTPTLACPDFNRTFCLQTDASNVGLGAVLTQTHEQGECVIAYASRTLTPAEMKYTTTELECLAVLWSIKKFRGYLEGYKFTVMTDHNSLRWLNNLKDPSGRLGRWALELMQYDFEIVYRKGSQNFVPDALSRIPSSGELELCSLAVSMNYPTTGWADTTDSWYTTRRDTLKATPFKFPDWKIEKVLLYYRRSSSRYHEELEDLEPWKLVVPSEFREDLLHEFHDTPMSGHLGVDKTYHRISRCFYWVGMYRTVLDFVRKCDICQRTKVSQQPPVGLMGRRFVEQPWEIVAVDVMGPLPKSLHQNAYIVAFQDLFTKWIECRAVRTVNGAKIKELLLDLVVTRWGTPRMLISDNGTEFVNKLLEQACREYKIHHSTTPVYHPQANPVERINRVVKTMITAFVGKNQREWDAHLSEFNFAYNTAHHSVIECSPAFLNFGRDLKPLPRELERVNDTPLAADFSTVNPWRERMKRMRDLHEWVTSKLESAYQQQAEKYNLRRRERPLKINDLVLFRHRPLSSSANFFSAKLGHRYQGPYRVIHFRSPTVIEIEHVEAKTRIKTHVNDVKLYVQSGLTAIIFFLATVGCLVPTFGSPTATWWPKPKEKLSPILRRCWTSGRNWRRRSFSSFIVTPRPPCNGDALIVALPATIIPAALGPGQGPSAFVVDGGDIQRGPARDVVRSTSAQPRWTLTYQASQARSSADKAFHVSDPPLHTDLSEHHQPRTHASGTNIIFFPTVATVYRFTRVTGILTWEYGDFETLILLLELPPFLFREYSRFDSVIA